MKARQNWGTAIVVRRWNHPPFLLFVIAMPLFRLNGAFVPRARPFRTITAPGSLTESNEPLLARSFQLYVVADAEKEELHKKKDENNDDEDDWIPTEDGGFLPNFLKFKASNPVREVTSLDDYKRHVADEKARLVCVRFYAPWCRACRAVQAPFRKLACDFESVKFVEVPLTQDNSFLHRGLGVPSLPFAHIYHPEAGLVEERSINKKIFSEFREILKNYVNGECPIDWDEQ